MEDFYTYRYNIDLDTLKQMWSGYSGRIGMIPYFYDNYTPHYMFTNIITKPYKAKGETTKTQHHLIGDFGGGFKTNIAPYDGLVAEVIQEAGQEIGNFLLDQLDNSPNVIIYVVENVPVFEKTTWFRYSIEILFLIDKNNIPKNFEKTYEVTDIMVIPEKELSEKLKEEVKDTKINMGIRLFKEMKSIP